MGKPARIVLDRFESRVPSWNWRSDWHARHESAYSLFAKFAYLNAFAVRDLIPIFISSGKKTATLRNPQVDLRDPTHFDIPAIAHVLQADLDDVKESFLFAMLPNGRRKSTDHLRWCPKCAAIGFHSPLFQLEIIANCPIHGTPLRSSCSACGAQTPYRLRRDVIEVPFSCSACHADFAPTMRNPSARSLQLRPESIERLQNVSEVLKFEDRLIPMKLEINRERKFHGMGEVVIAPADLRRRHAEYTGFVIEVLDELKADMSTFQPPLSLAQITRIDRGARPEAITSAKRSKKKYSHLHRRNSSLPAVRKSWDDMLNGLYTVYAANRRWIWRHVITEHQSCVVSAARRLWWHMEGESTVAFCPVAEAFLRWRMLWEGCGVPQHLLSPLTKPPFGIVGWQAQAAPICPCGWSKATEIWVTQHCFARACLSNFREWLDIALTNSENGKIDWTRHAVTGKFETYWALAGHDSWHQPVRIYLQVGERREWESFLVKLNDAKHHQYHQVQISQLKR